MRNDIPLPADQEAEKVFTSSLFYFPHLINEYRGILEVDDFTLTPQRLIFKTLVEMVDGNIPIDYCTFSEQLNGSDLGVLSSVEVLTEIEILDRTEHVEIFAKNILDCSARRRFILGTEHLQAKAYKGEDVTGLLNELQRFSIEIENKTFEPESSTPLSGKLVKSGHIADRIMNYYDNGFQLQGMSTDWTMLSMLYKPARGTLNIVTGIPGHGKSEFMDALMVNISLVNNFKWCVFSPENYPFELHVQKISEKLIRKHMLKGDRMSKPELQTAMNWIDENFSFVELHENRSDLDTLLALVKQTKQRNGLDGLVIDPWNELEVQLRKGESETDFIGRSLTKIRRFARKNDIAAFIVAHPKKMNKDEKGRYLIPTVYDINGSANWFNKADNAVTIYRNFGEGEENTIDVYVQKIKFKVHGEIGCVRMTYDKVTGTLEEINF
jgi:replicative DNA helicase